MPRKRARPESTTSRASVCSRLLAWYTENLRDLPFRRTRDPYAIWVSEVMLQQTQVATVLAYYARWMQRFPTIEALARAAEDDVLSTWQGLGYYSRARRLQAAARVVLDRHGGHLPRERAALTALPGIGEYSAGAILSIAFGKREPLIDGNVVRVLCRHFGLRGDPTRAPLKPALWQLAAELVPEARPGDFNQALMELGATVCTPRGPRCAGCPLAATCRALAEGSVAELPELPERRPVTPLRAAAALVERRGELLFCRLPADAPRWAGLWVLPHAELREGESASRGLARALSALGGPEITVGPRLGAIEHTITRFRVTLEAFQCRVRQPRTPGSPSLWRKPDATSDLALPAPHRKLLARFAGGAP